MQTIHLSVESSFHGTIQQVLTDIVDSASIVLNVYLMAILVL